ncbi:hypothetical protein GCM10020000_24280 [Streptomyces olivoverticillatus]
MATDTGQISADKKTYTFKLREGLTWEDGQPVTTQQIKYGIERTWAQDKISGGPTWLMQVLDPGKEYKGPYKDDSKDKLGLKAIDTPDEKTIVFHLPKPNGDFLQMLAMPAAGPVRQDKDTAEKYGLKPFSNGPYKWVSYTPNKGLELTRNDKWNKSSDSIRKALPDKITVKLTSNADDMDNRLIAERLRPRPERHRHGLGGPPEGAAVRQGQRRQPADRLHPLRGVPQVGRALRQRALPQGGHLRRRPHLAADRPRRPRGGR